MKKRFTKLIIPLLCIMGGALPIWGQVRSPQGNGQQRPTNYVELRSGTETAFYDDSHANVLLCNSYTIGVGTFSWKNNFGPGENGTISPGTPNPFNASTHDGEITVGGTENVVLNVSNTPSVTVPWSWSASITRYRHRSWNSGTSG